MSKIRWLTFAFQVAGTRSFYSRAETPRKSLLGASCLVIACTLLAAVPGVAQYWSGLNEYGTPQSALMDHVMTGEINRIDPLQKTRARTKATTRARAVPAPSTAVPLTATDFVRESPRQLAALAAQVGPALAVQPGMEQQLAVAMEQLCAQLELSSTMRKDNVAYGLATMIAVATEIRVGQAASPLQIAQYAGRLNERWSTLAPSMTSAAAMQTFYDTCLGMTALMLGLQGRFSGANADSLETAKQLAESVLNKYVAGWNAR